MPTPAVQQFPLEEEYRKNIGIKPQDISQLRQWLGTQPHLPAQHITDLDLILTYHCCSKSTEVTKQVLDLHYTLRTLFTGLFKDRAVDAKILKTLHVVLPLPLDVRSRDGDAVMYVRLINYDVKNLVLEEAVRTILMVMDLWQFEEGTWPGFVLLIDMDKVVLGHLSRVDLQVLQQFLYYLQEAVLVKLKGVHFLNAPSFMDKLMLMMRPFLKRALLDTMCTHLVGSRTLDKFVPIEGLPEEAGGKFKTLDKARDDVTAKIKANEEFFALENKKRVVEALRPGRPKTISDVFGGVEGSFKKLDID